MVPSGIVAGVSTTVEALCTYSSFVDISQNPTVRSPTHDLIKRNTQTPSLQLAASPPQTWQLSQDTAQCHQVTRASASVSNDICATRRWQNYAEQLVLPPDWALSND